jgi:hypothetical protein
VANPWIYHSGYVFRRHFPDRTEMVCEEVTVLKDVELELDKLVDKMRDDGIREVVYGTNSQENRCMWCHEPITDENRKYFCCEEHQVDWLKKKKRQAELEDNPGIGSGG